MSYKWIDPHSFMDVLVIVLLVNDNILNVFLGGLIGKTTGLFSYRA
jgi:hypothetical protein